MSFKQSTVQTSADPAGADDFKLIHGIGPAIAQRLQAGGLHRFAELAAMSPEELVSLLSDLAGLSAERVIKQNWIGQASALVAQAATPEQAAPLDRQHYATFTVELLLDQRNDVRRTRAVYVQTGMEAALAGWQERELLQFIVRQSGLRIEQAATASTGEGDHRPTGTSAPAEQLRLVELAIRPENASGSRHLLGTGQAFSVELMLEYAALSPAAAPEFSYCASVYAKDLGSQARHMVSDAQGRFSPATQPSLVLAGTSLPRGIYRLEAVVVLSRPGADARREMMLEGGLLQIY